VQQAAEIQYYEYLYNEEQVAGVLNLFNYWMHQNYD
jgi:hypothetical protein